MFVVVFWLFGCACFGLVKLCLVCFGFRVVTLYCVWFLLISCTCRFTLLLLVYLLVAGFACILVGLLMSDRGLVICLCLGCLIWLFVGVWLLCCCCFSLDWLIWLLGCWEFVFDFTVCLFCLFVVLWLVLFEVVCVVLLDLLVLFCLVVLADLLGDVVCILVYCCFSLIVF